VPAAKDKAIEGDYEGALAEAQDAISKIDGLPGKAGYVGGVIAVDAVVHLPVLSALIPGPVEFLGTAAALLLASRYYVTKESTLEEDTVAFFATLPGELPAAGDIGTLLQPATNLVTSVTETDFDILQDDVKQAPSRVQRWVAQLDEPAADIGPPAAALGATVLLGQLVHLPLLGLVLPRALEVLGMAYVIAAVNKYGSDEQSSSVTDDLAAAAKQGGDAVKILAGKEDKKGKQ